MTATATGRPTPYQGNDKLLFGIIMGVIAFWLFAQTTLNVAPDMQKDLGLDASMMNIAVAITATKTAMIAPAAILTSNCPA